MANTAVPFPSPSQGPDGHLASSVVRVLGWFGGTRLPLCTLEGGRVIKEEPPQNVSPSLPLSAFSTQSRGRGVEELRGEEHVARVGTKKSSFHAIEKRGKGGKAGQEMVVRF